MTFDPCRRRGRYGVAGVRARQKPADLHQGTCEDFLRRHDREAAEAGRRGGEPRKVFVSKLLQRTADARNLRLAWDYLARGGGPTPGVDGLRFHDLEDDEVWGLVRVLHGAILNDDYRTAKDRTQKILKASGKGYRTLSIPTVIDRVVQRAIVQTTQPYLDCFFDDRSFGFRPSSHVYMALATAEKVIVENDSWTLLTEDVRNAFDHVPQGRLLDVVRRLIPNDEMVRLIGRVVQTKIGRGLRQGGNLSPLLLNVYLIYFLDRKWRKLHPNMALIRWADDLLIPCRTTEEARNAYQDLERLLLPTGMSLKSNPEQAVHELKSGNYAEWLGYRLFRDGNGMKASLTDKAWTSLKQKLELDHEKESSPLRAAETIRGWISQMGPCFEQKDATRDCARIATTARDLAFDEIPTTEEMRRTWRTAHLAWRRVRDRVGSGAAVRSEGGSACREPDGLCRAGTAS